MMRQDSPVREVEMSTDFSGGPGFLAFVVTFGVVIASIVLFLSLSRHLRKVRAREAREAAEREAAAGTASGDGEGRERGGDEVAGESGDR
jgi:hypothetical protein